MMNLKKYVISAIFCTLVAPITVFANGNCEGFVVTFTNTLPDNVKVANASLIGAEMTPTHFMQLESGGQKSITLHNVSADTVTGYFEFQTEAENSKTVTVNFDLSDAYFFHCSHSSNNNGTDVSHSRSYGSVHYSIK